AGAADASKVACSVRRRAPAPAPVNVPETRGPYAAADGGRVASRPRAMSRARLTVVAASLLALAAASALALPDLAPELYGIAFDANQSVSTGDMAEGCATATDGRLLLRFGVRLH